jgi:hypothetical protein
MPGMLAGRITKSWSYREMFDRADLVIVATPISTKDTDERTTLQDLRPPVGVVAILTEFKTLLVMKGAKDIQTFQLHHYRLESEELRETLEDGPDLVRIRIEDHSTFLLFLTKESNGRYAPVTGQTDPALFSVLELKGAAD